jgi:hypothetical protein
MLPVLGCRRVVWPRMPSTEGHPLSGRAPERSVDPVRKAPAHHGTAADGFQPVLDHCQRRAMQDHGNLDLLIFHLG